MKHERDITKTYQSIAKQTFTCQLGIVTKLQMPTFKRNAISKLTSSIFFSLQIECNDSFQKWIYIISPELISVNLGPNKLKHGAALIGPYFTTNTATLYNIVMNFKEIYTLVC